VDVQKKYNRSEHQDLRDDLQKAILKLEQKYSKKNSVLA
jgi:hypothetical protein